eukprot:gene5207-10426_t
MYGYSSNSYEYEESSSRDNQDLSYSTDDEFNYANYADPFTQAPSRKVTSEPTIEVKTPFPTPFMLNPIYLNMATVTSSPSTIFPDNKNNLKTPPTRGKPQSLSPTKFPSAIPVKKHKGKNKTPTGRIIKIKPSAFPTSAPLSTSGKKKRGRSTKLPTPVPSTEPTYAMTFEPTSNDDTDKNSLEPTLYGPDAASGDTDDMAGSTYGGGVFPTGGGGGGDDGTTEDDSVYPTHDNNSNSNDDNKDDKDDDSLASSSSSSFEDEDEDEDDIYPSLPVTTTTSSTSPTSVTATTTVTTPKSPQSPSVLPPSVLPPKNDDKDNDKDKGTGSGSGSGSSKPHRSKSKAPSPSRKQPTPVPTSSSTLTDPSQSQTPDDDPVPEIASTAPTPVSFADVLAATFIRTLAVVLLLTAVGVAWYQNKDVVASSFFSFFSRGGAPARYQEMEMTDVAEGS